MSKEALKKCKITRYDYSIKEPPYETIQIDSAIVSEPENDDYGEEFAERLRIACSSKGYVFKFYTLVINTEYDYEIVVY